MGMLLSWKDYCLAGLAACLVLSLALLNHAWTKVAEKTAVIESMHREAQAYESKSKEIADETSNAFTTLVESIKSKDTALKNARAKFGSCNVAGGITAVGLLRAKDGVGEAYVPSSTSESHLSESVAVSPDFINACAADAAFVGAVQQWRVANELPISQE